MADDQEVTTSLRFLATAFLLILGFSLTGCATLGASWNTAQQEQVVIQKVLETGRSLVGHRPESRVTVNGRAFVLDCVGTVSAAWWGAGIDLQKQFSRYRGDAVNRIYDSLQDWGALHWQPTPRPGDLIVWDNTWDVAGDANYPDGHTHLGLVLAVDSRGQITYLHESVSRGIVLAYMNLFHPDEALDSAGHVVNSPMYLGSNFGRKDNPPRWTSGQLWSAFADGAVIVRVNFRG